MLYGDRGSVISLCLLPKKRNMLDTNKHKQQVPKIVMATVFLKSKTGRSLLPIFVTMYLKLYQWTTSILKSVLHPLDPIDFK